LNELGFTFGDEVKPHSTYELVFCAHTGCQFAVRIDKARKSTAREKREHRVYLVGRHTTHMLNGPNPREALATLPEELTLSFDDEPEQDTIRELELRENVPAASTSAAFHFDFVPVSFSMSPTLSESARLSGLHLSSPTPSRSDVSSFRAQSPLALGPPLQESIRP
jgi:hypothetical protein